MANHRTARVAEEIKRELCQMIRDELKITAYRTGQHNGCRVSNDLHFAKVYVSRLGEAEEIKNTLPVWKKRQVIFAQVSKDCI